MMNEALRERIYFDDYTLEFISRQVLVGMEDENYTHLKEIATRSNQHPGAPRNLSDSLKPGQNFVTQDISNAYGILHYIHRNVSVGKYEVPHCVMMLVALIRNNLDAFFQ